MRCGREASPLELSFGLVFGLVFVLAVSQLSEHLPCPCRATSGGRPPPARAARGA